MENAIKQQRTINEVIKGYRNLAKICVIGFIVFSLAISFLLYKFFEKSSAQVFLARDFTSTERILDEKAMLTQHIKNFYTLFFEMDQASFKQRTDDALYLVGRSGVELRNRYAEAGWYRQMVQNNVTLTVDIDSIGIDISKYPYEVVVLAKQNVVRESVVSTRYLNSTFKVVKVGNSLKNPFGYMIENFIITDNKEYVPAK